MPPLQPTDIYLAFLRSKDWRNSRGQAFPPVYLFCWLNVPQASARAALTRSQITGATRDRISTGCVASSRQLNHQPHGTLPLPPAHYFPMTTAAFCTRLYWHLTLPLRWAPPSTAEHPDACRCLPGTPPGTGRTLQPTFCSTRVHAAQQQAPVPGDRASTTPLPPATQPPTATNSQHSTIPPDYGYCYAGAAFPYFMRCAPLYAAPLH